VATYELSRSLRESGVHVIGGFHTHMEGRVLGVLLKGAQLITIVPARSLEKYRIPKEWRPGVEAGHIRLLSPFANGQHRITRKLARERNRFVMEQADHILFIHASPGGDTEALCKEAIDTGKNVYCMKSPNNQHLVELGAQAAAIEELTSALAGRMPPK
jgi:predicted Rossmann fold nucleotide-binding protein DprA/Smf involved in DNA uptake